MWPFFNVKMRQNGLFFRNLHEKLGEKKSYGGSNMNSKIGPIRKSTISLKMVQNRQS
jgi:hypothetical protein